MSRLRPVSTLNKPFLYLSSLVNGNSSEIVEFDGRLDTRLLHEAVQATVKRHPALNSRLRRRGLLDYWEPAADLPSVNIVFQQCDEATVHEQLRTNVWGEPLNVYRERPLRVYLIEASRRHVLQFVSTHVWSDARAGWLLAAGVADAYGRLAAGRAPETAAVDIPDRHRPALFTAGQPRSSFYYWSRALSAIGRDMVTSGRGLVLKGRRGATDFAKLPLEPALLERLRETARRRGVTVHAYLTVALLRTSEIFNRSVTGGRVGAARRILDLFSLRRFAARDADELYDTMVLPFALTLDRRLDDAALLGSVAGQLSRLKDGDILVEFYRQRLYALTAMLLPKRLATALVTRFIAKGNLIGTNPGPIDLPLERFGDVPIADFYNFSQLFPPGRLMCIFNTFRGRLRLTLVYDSGALDELKRKKFVDTLLAELDRLLEHTPAATDNQKTESA